MVEGQGSPANIMLTTFLAALTGGIVFTFLHIPLAWMLGSLSAVLVYKIGFDKSVCWPIGIRNGGLLFLGYSMGSPFTPDMARQIMAQLPMMAVTNVLTVGFCLLLGVWVARKTGITLASAAMGSVPGGLSQMVVLGEEVKDTDMGIVTFMQTARLLSVVFVIPFIAVHGLTGGSGSPAAAGTVAASWTWGKAVSLSFAVAASVVLAKQLHFPNAFMLGPILGIAALSISGISMPDLPRPLILAAQFTTGTYMGVNIKPADPAVIKSLLGYTLLSVLGLLVFSLAMGFLLTMVYPFGAVTGFLSTAPGGMTEMGLTAMAVNADLSTVVAYQIFRLMFILVVVLPGLKYWLNKKVEA